MAAATISSPTKANEPAEIRARFADLQRRYREYLPKVDPALIDDLMLRQLENPSEAPVYMVEVFTREGLDPDSGRQYIMDKTGMVPAIFDNGTHYVTNQKLTLEMLKEISDSNDVLEVTGEYTGGIGGYGASHEHREHGTPRRLLAEPRQATTMQQQASVAAAAAPAEQKREDRRASYRWAIYTAIGIVGAIALAGFIISGGVPPNANVPASPASSVTPAGLAGDVPGVLHGHVTGPTGLPAIGASIVAAEQSSGYTVNEFVSITGQYYLDLPAGKYVVVAAYPDGTNRVVNGFAVQGGAEHELDFRY
jgi:hypothetical protein